MLQKQRFEQQAVLFGNIEFAACHNPFEDNAIG